MKKIAVLGARGMLGTDLVNIAQASDYEVISYDLPHFDIRKESDLLSACERADAIVNCAAYTDVEKAELEREKCFAINSKAVGLLGEICAKLKRYLIHISTDFVFGDLKMEAQKEDDKPNPLNVYGESKLSGEFELIKSGADFCIVRVEWTYGVNGNNFLKKILQRAKEEKELKIVNDQFGSPTWTLDAAKAIMILLEKKAEGVYHFAARGYASRFDVAKFAIECAGLNAQVNPCSSAELRTKAKRPLNSRFDCSRIDSILPYERPDWRESVRGFIAELKRGDKI